MARFKYVNNELIEITGTELTQLEAKEKAWNDGAFDRSMADLRQKRNSLLQETDWWGASDNTMTAEQTKYRQDLRDITNGLTTVEEVEAVEFPTKPS
tara:strand:- start:283 stop:573 length:291 start_codon:yes stop_codon:yes gene_type:complete